MSRVPPHDLEAEKAALGAVFVRASTLVDDLGTLTADDFFLPAHRDIFDAMRSVAKRGRTPDPVVVADELKSHDLLSRLDGGIAYLTELAAPMVLNAKQYARIIAEKALLRRLIAKCADVMSSAQGDVGDVPEFMATVRQKMAAIDSNAPSELVSFGMIADELYEELGEREKKHLTTGSAVMGVPFGVDELDQLLGGALPGDLGIIAAETSGGKTALAMQAMVNLVVSGGSGLAINLEMPRIQLAERAVSYVARVNSALMRTGRIGEAKSGWDDVRTAIGRLRDTSLWLEDRASTMPAICSAARKWRAKHSSGAGMVVVDFAQLIRGSGDRKVSRAQEVGVFGQELKALAKELRVPVILISQINRVGVKSDRPSKFDLKESGDLENAADWIVIIHNRDTTGDDPVDFYLDKNRNGEKGKRSGWWTGRHYRFTDSRPINREGNYGDAE